MGNNRKADIKDSNEGGERGEHELNFGEGGSVSSEEVELPKPCHGGISYGVGDEEFSKSAPLSAVQSPWEITRPGVAVPESYMDQFERSEIGEGASGDRAEPEEAGDKGPAGRATDTPDTKGRLGTAVGLWPEDIGVGSTGNPLVPKTKEHEAVKLQPGGIGEDGTGNKESPVVRGMRAEGDEIVDALKVSDQGAEEEAAKVGSRGEELKETKEVPKHNRGVKGAPKADEEDARSSARVLDQGKNPRGRDSGLSPQQLPTIEEISLDGMAREASSTDPKSVDIGQNSGAAEGHEREINHKLHNKLPVKRVSFAPEPSESDSEEESISPEAVVLGKNTDIPGEPRYNTGTSKGHNIPIDEKQHDQPAETKFQSAQKSRKSPGTEEPWKIAEAQGEFGTNYGPIKDHNRAIHEKRQSQPAGKESRPTQQPEPNPETEELKRVADVVGEFGYNIGTIKGHDRAIDNRHHGKHAPSNAHAPAGPASESQLSYVGTERTSEPQEPGNMTIGSGEPRYKVGDQPSFGPGRHKPNGEDTQGQRTISRSGTSAEISEGEGSDDDTSTKTPATNGTAEFRELGNITLERGDFGYNIGGLPSSHPGRHRRHSHGGLQDQAGQKTSESRRLGQTKLGNGEFGYNISDLEHRQTSEKEHPTASGSRHRNKQPTSGDPSHTSSIRDGENHRHPDEGGNHFAQTKESQQQSLSKFTPGGTVTNDTSQSHLHNLTSQSSSRPVYPPEPVHATEAIEPENPSAPPGQQPQAITAHELCTAPADPKSDLIASIAAESRPRKAESDPGNIRKQPPNAPQTETGGHHSNVDTEVKIVKVEVRPYPNKVKSREEGMGKIVVWGVIGVGVITALGLATLWGGFSHAAIGFGFREGVDWSDKLAEWLFKEGKKGPS